MFHATVEDRTLGDPGHAVLAGIGIHVEVAILVFERLHIDELWLLLVWIGPASIRRGREAKPDNLRVRVVDGNAEMHVDRHGAIVGIVTVATLAVVAQYGWENGWMAGFFICVESIAGKDTLLVNPVLEALKLVRFDAPIAVLLAESLLEEGVAVEVIDVGG